MSVPTITQKINVRLDLPNGVAVKRAAVRAVLDIHRVVRIFDECGHHHEYTEDGSVPDGLREISEIGLVCEEGYQFSICRECCTDPEGAQSQLCELEHDQLGVQVRMNNAGAWVVREPCWPCPTVRAIAEALGVQP